VKPTSALQALKEAANEAQKNILANERETDDERRAANTRRIKCALNEVQAHLDTTRRGLPR
jgi:hypothetical protein